MAYSGWKLEDEDRERLLEVFPPRYPDVVAHHVTKNLHQTIPSPAEINIVGYCDDGAGVECLVVTVNGNKNRSDGSIYHITWSLDRGAGCKPVHSNAALQAVGFSEIDPIPVTTRAFAVDNNKRESFSDL